MAGIILKNDPRHPDQQKPVKDAPKVAADVRLVTHPTKEENKTEEKSDKKDE